MKKDWKITPLFHLNSMYLKYFIIQATYDTLYRKLLELILINSLTSLL